MSLPSRGAWIEITAVYNRVADYPDSRFPHGERGLKSGPDFAPGNLRPSLPSRGAWIEMGFLTSTTSASRMSLPSRGAWIEIATRL